MNKICTVCKIFKPFTDFYKHNRTKDNLCGSCKECMNYTKHLWKLENKDKNNEYLKIGRVRHPWYATLRSILGRCNNIKHKSYKYYGGNGIKNFLKVKDLKVLWFRDKAYNLKRPSIDRINKTDNYTFKNCRYIELTENIRRNQ